MQEKKFHSSQPFASAGTANDALSTGSEKTDSPTGSEKTISPTGSEKTISPTGSEKTISPTGSETTASPAGCPELPDRYRDLHRNSRIGRRTGSPVIRARQTQERY